MRRISILLLLASLNGCVGNDMIVQRQSSLEWRLEQTMQAQNSAKSELAAVTASMQELKDHAARQSTAERELLLKYEGLQDKVKLLSNRLAQLEASAKQSATIELVNQGNIQEGLEESVQAAYIKAFGLFSENNFSAAAEAFTSFIAAYPESEYAGNARYWLGECNFSLGRYKEAIESFSRVLEMNPLPKRAAEAMLRIGTAWYLLEDPAKGAAVLRMLIEQYPGSEAAEAAGKQLEKK